MSHTPNPYKRKRRPTPSNGLQDATGKLEFVNEAKEYVALIFDTETTGLINLQKPYHDPCQPELIQLGFILVKTSNFSRPLMKFSSLVKPECKNVKMEPKAQSVHGISLNDCKQFGISCTSALKVLSDALQCADILVAHNLRFDFLVLETALFRTKFESTEYFNKKKTLYDVHQVCTMKICTDIMKLPSISESSQYKWPTLSESYQYFLKKKFVNGHDALNDAEACLEIFRVLLQSGSISLENKKPVISSTPLTPLTHSQTTENSVSISNSPNWSSPSIKQIMGNQVTPMKSDSINISKTEDGFFVSGQHTFLLEKRFRELGGRWNKEKRAWYFEGLHYLSSVRRILRANDEDSRNDNEENNEYWLRRAKRPKRGELFIVNGKKSQDIQILVKGNTYQYKDTLKALGGIWNPDQRGWSFNKAQEIIVFKFIYGFGT